MQSILATLLMALPLTFALPSAAPGSDSSDPTVVIAIEANWDDTNKLCNQSYAFDFNQPLHLQALDHVQALYLVDTEGVDGRVVCKPHWTAQDGDSMVGLFLTKKTPSRPLDIAGGWKLQVGADLSLKCEIGSQ